MAVLCSVVLETALNLRELAHGLNVAVFFIPSSSVYLLHTSSLSLSLLSGCHNDHIPPYSPVCLSTTCILHNTHLSIDSNPLLSSLPTSPTHQLIQAPHYNICRLVMSLHTTDITQCFLLYLALVSSSKWHHYNWLTRFHSACFIVESRNPFHTLHNIDISLYCDICVIKTMSHQLIKLVNSSSGCEWSKRST